jgi:hypothetical protein
MAFQATGSPHSSQVIKSPFSPVVGKNNSRIKVDEMGNGSNAMGIMTCSTGRSLLNNVLPVFGETLITQQGTAIVTFIAECIRLCILRG